MISTLLWLFTSLFLQLSLTALDNFLIGIGLLPCLVTSKSSLVKEPWSDAVCFSTVAYKTKMFSLFDILLTSPRSVGEEHLVVDGVAQPLQQSYVIVILSGWHSSREFFGSVSEKSSPEDPTMHWPTSAFHLLFFSSLKTPWPEKWKWHLLTFSPFTSTRNCLSVAGMSSEFSLLFIL